MPAPLSGARPALAVTVMLTTATVFLAASENTPQSNMLTVLSRVYLVCFSISAVLVIISVMTTSLCLIGPDDKISEQALRDWFCHFDVDNSGYLDREEAAHALMALGLDQKERERVFRIFDANNDGSIDMEEWRAISEITKKHDNLATFHNVITMGLVKSRMWRHEANVRKVHSQYEDDEGLKRYARLAQSSLRQMMVVSHSTAAEGMSQVRRLSRSLSAGRIATDGAENDTADATADVEGARGGRESVGGSGTSFGQQDQQQDQLALPGEISSAPRLASLEPLPVRSGTTSPDNQGEQRSRGHDLPRNASIHSLGSGASDAIAAGGAHPPKDKFWREQHLHRRKSLQQAVTSLRPIVQGVEAAQYLSQQAVKAQQEAELDMHKAGQNINRHSFMQSTPQKWGKHIAAEIDYYSFLILFILFLCYLAVELSGFISHHASKTEQAPLRLLQSNEFRLTQAGYANHTGITVFTKDERRVSGQVQCFSNLSALCICSISLPCMSALYERRVSGQVHCFSNLQHLSQEQFDQKWRNLEHRSSLRYDKFGNVNAAAAVCHESVPIS